MYKAPITHSSSLLKTVGLFGGTFDPIHKGHIDSALELKQRLALDELRLIPCHQPPHRSTVVCNSQQRITMVNLRLKSEPRLLVDDREMRRNAVSYTFDTLEQVRNELGTDISLCWIMGTDAFASLDSWYRWTELLDLAHLIVIRRPGATLPQTGQIAKLKLEHSGDKPEMLKERCAGALIFESLNPYPVSATLVRDAIQAFYRGAQVGDDLRDDNFLRSVITQPVLDYIQVHELYRN